MTASETSLEETMTHFLRDRGVGPQAESGNYRSECEREIYRFLSWLVDGLEDEHWSGINPSYKERGLTFSDVGSWLDSHSRFNEPTALFRAYARHLRGKDFAPSTVRTYYAYVSAWAGWCQQEGYFSEHYATRADAREPIPEEERSRSDTKQMWGPEERKRVTRTVDQLFHDAADELSSIHVDDTLDRERQRFKLLKTARNRALVYLLAYTGARTAEILADPRDSRREGLLWEDVNLESQSATVYRKRRGWDDLALPEPVIAPLSQYRNRLSPPSAEWSVFPTFAYPKHATLVTDTLADRGWNEETIEEFRQEHARDFFILLQENITPPSATKRLATSVLTDLHEDHDVEMSETGERLEPHGGRRGMGEVMVREYGFPTAARFLDNSEEMVREAYSHLEAADQADQATQAIKNID